MTDAPEGIVGRSSRWIVDCEASSPRPDGPEGRTLDAADQVAICGYLAKTADFPRFHPRFLGYAYFQPGARVFADRASFEGDDVENADPDWDGVQVALQRVDAAWTATEAIYLLEGARVSGKSASDARRLAQIVRDAGLLSGAGKVIGYPHLMPPKSMLEKPRVIKLIRDGDVEGTRCENRATKTNYGADSVVVLRAASAREMQIDELCVFVRGEEIVYIFDIFGEI